MSAPRTLYIPEPSARDVARGLMRRRNAGTLWELAALALFFAFIVIGSGIAGGA